MPHTDRFSPDVTARLTDNGVPVVGAQVRFIVNSAGLNTGQHLAVGSTNASGEVTFAAPSVGRWVMSFGDRKDSWEVIFSTPNALSVQRGSWWGGPATETIECDVLSPLTAAQSVVLTDTSLTGNSGSANCSATSP